MERRAHAIGGLRSRPRTWLVTGAAGFIGSHLVERLLGLGQEVRELDDFSTGSRANLDEVRAAAGEAAWGRFSLVEGDIRDPAACARALRGVSLVLHQAALGSVQRSIARPFEVQSVNVGGFLRVALAARDAGCERLVYASSSSVYGDHPALPRREDTLGAPLSPYAATKRANELFAASLAHTYGLRSVGLRYFNVFGPRQDPRAPHAAVVPRWIAALLAGERPRVFGDGSRSRDFCPVAVAVEANLLAATAPELIDGAAYNVALGRRTTLLELLALLRESLAARGVSASGLEPLHGEARAGDVRHSEADTSRARAALGLRPATDLEHGIEATVDWFLARRDPFGPSLSGSEDAG